MNIINNYIYNIKCYITYEFIRIPVALVGSLFDWIRARLIRSSFLNPISFNNLIYSSFGVVVCARYGTFVFCVGIDNERGFLVSTIGAIYFLKKLRINIGKRQLFIPNILRLYNIPDIIPITKDGKVLIDSERYSLYYIRFRILF